MPPANAASSTQGSSSVGSPTSRSGITHRTWSPRWGGSELWLVSRPRIADRPPSAFWVDLPTAGRRKSDPKRERGRVVGGGRVSGGGGGRGSFTGRESHP